jgi:hypothetical protein
MTDHETIIRSLRTVDRRLRRNRLLRGFSFALALFLVVPLGFKLFGLFIPLTATTVWFLAMGAYCVRLLKKQSTLSQTAAALDQRLALNDELKTACWFIENPRSSDWVNTQIRRAASSAEKVDVDRLYPRTIPKALYVACGMFLLLVGMNAVPLSSSDNKLSAEAETESPSVLEALLGNFGRGLNLAPRKAAEEQLQEAKQGAGWQSPLPDQRMAIPNTPPGNEATGLEPSGDSVPNPPRLGPPTTLKVQLEKEKLTGQQSEGKQQDPEQGSKKEESTLAYTNVESNLRPAQKDVLNQDWIPSKYRPLIKDYFEAIRPSQ